MEKYKPIFDNNGNLVNKEELKGKLYNHVKKYIPNINLDNPKTIQDKLNWLIVNDTTLLKTNCADKIKLHEYCEKTLGRDICVPLIGVYNSSSEINWDRLPKCFVMKCNHGSGMNIIVRDKNSIIKEHSLKKLDEWLNDDFSMRNSYEIQYSNIERKILIEAYLRDENQKNSLYDYKFWCFNGIPKLYTINDGNGHGDIMYYDMNDNMVNLYGLDENKCKNNYSKPLNFDLMVEYSKKLSENFKFVRVDFYEVDGRIYLGEMTFTPGACLFKYKTEENDLFVGDFLSLPDEDKINTLIVHYNTPKLTEYLVKSINKFTPNCKIYIFDNSDKMPFTYKQNNLIYFDNTHGQIIDFDKWLDGFPNKNLESGRANGWGSAKHAYSVDVCMNLIPNGFILLDSDVLLKKDISELWDESKIFVGGIEGYWSIFNPRIAPYCCFINVPMCKKYNINYLDTERMCGFNKRDKNGRGYDTGSSFYLDSKKHDNTVINYHDYVVHYRGGSWLENFDKGRKGDHKITVDEWLDEYKYLWENNIKNKVIYTCVTNSYENIINLTVKHEEYDYVCFTDNPKIKSDFWQIRPIPTELLGLSKIKQQRLIKIYPHKYLKDYDLSIWIDCSVDIIGNIEDITSKLDNNKTIFIGKHPDRNCIYDEMNACSKYNKDTITNMSPQIVKYESEGFPRNFGLVQSNIIFRRHNNEECIKIMELWAQEVINGSHRDQLSFNYCLWKLGDSTFEYLDKKIYNSKWFKWYSKHDRGVVQTNNSPQKMLIDQFINLGTFTTSNTTERSLKTETNNQNEKVKHKQKERLKKRKQLSKTLATFLW